MDSSIALLRLHLRLGLSHRSPKAPGLCHAPLAFPFASLEMVPVHDERGADEQGDEQDPVVRAVAREDRVQTLSNRREDLLRGLRERRRGRRGQSVEPEYEMYGWSRRCMDGWMVDDWGVRDGGFGRSNGDGLAGWVTSKRTSNSFARKAGPDAMTSRASPVRSRHWSMRLRKNPTLLRRPSD